MIPRSYYGAIQNRGIPAADISSASTFTSVSNEAASKTLTAQGLGIYDPNRRTIISIQWRNASAATLDTVTVGGVSCTRVIRAQGSPNTSNAEIWTVDTGVGTALESLTSANIVLTASIANSAYTVVVYRTVGLNLTATSSVADISAPISQSVTVPSSGIAIGVCSTGSTSAAAWDTIVETLNATSFTVTKGVHAYTTTTGVQTISLSGTVSLPVAVIATFGP